MTHVTEAMGPHLLRVIKMVRKRGEGGRKKLVKQAYYVRKTKPGDQHDVGASVVGGEPGAVPPPEEQPQEEQPEPIPDRMTVRFHEVPWIRPDAQLEKDPIPPKVREKFSQDNRVHRVTNPFGVDEPVVLVKPTDPVLWGYNEPDLAHRLRTGVVERMRVSRNNPGLILARVEDAQGISANAYLFFEALRDPYLYHLWGEEYDLKKEEGSVSRRAAAVYETAKAIGYDDLVPPTVFRNDAEGDVSGVIPDSLFEDTRVLVDAIAATTGEDPALVRKRVRGPMAVQLTRGDHETIEEQEWFQRLFQAEGESEKQDMLNRLFAYLPDSIAVLLVRITVLDWLLWVADRHFGDLVFCEDERHPVHLVGGDVCLPSPRKMANMPNISSGTGLWSEFLSMLTLRGGEKEIGIVEELAGKLSVRMKGDRPFELANTLLGHRIDPLSIAALFTRIGLFSRVPQIVKDPYIVANYYTASIQGEVPPPLAEVLEFTNATMKHALVRDFDFIAELRSAEEADESPEKDQGSEDLQDSDGEGRANQ